MRDVVSKAQSVHTLFTSCTCSHHVHTMFTPFTPCSHPSPTRLYYSTTHDSTARLYYSTLLLCYITLQYSSSVLVCYTICYTTLLHYRDILLQYSAIKQLRTFPTSYLVRIPFILSSTNSGAI